MAERNEIEIDGEFFHNYCKIYKDDLIILPDLSLHGSLGSFKSVSLIVNVDMKKTGRLIKKAIENKNIQIEV